MLGTLPPEAKVHWPEHVSSLVHVFSCTKSTAMDYSPYYLLYSREPLLLSDVEFGVKIPMGEEQNTHKYVQQLHKQLRSAYTKAKEK